MRCLGYLVQNQRNTSSQDEYIKMSVKLRMLYKNLSCPSLDILSPAFLFLEVDVLLDVRLQHRLQLMDELLVVDRHELDVQTLLVEVGLKEVRD